MSPEKQGQAPIGRTPSPLARRLQEVEPLAVENESVNADPPVQADDGKQKLIAEVESELHGPKKEKRRLMPKLNFKVKYPNPRREIVVKSLLSTLVVFLMLTAVAFLSLVAAIIVCVVLLLSMPFIWNRRILDRILPPRYKLVGQAPEKGFRGGFWRIGGKWLYSRLGWVWLSSPSWKERDRIAGERLWELRKVQKIVAFTNSKGGSAKTALAVWLIAIYMDLIKRPMTAFDVNESPGSTADRLGIEEEGTIQLRDYIESFEKGEIKDAENFLDQADSHRQTGVMVIASDPVLNEDIPKYKFARALANAKRQAHTVFCDLGNEIKGPTNLVSVQMADTLVFAGNVHMANSLKDLGKTQTRYAGLEVPKKVQQGVIAIVGDRTRTNKQVMRKRMGYAEQYDYPVERVLVIPKNNYMAAGKVVDITKIPLKLRVLLKEALVAIVLAEVVKAEVKTTEDYERRLPQPAQETQQES
jgi:MinD-like ATPase involved in chromosome partitioning or flagellar assembly